MSRPSQSKVMMGGSLHLSQDSSMNLKDDYKTGQTKRKQQQHKSAKKDKALTEDGWMSLTCIHLTLQGKKKSTLGLYKCKHFSECECITAYHSFNSKGVRGSQCRLDDMNLMDYCSWVLGAGSCGLAMSEHPIIKRSQPLGQHCRLLLTFLTETTCQQYHPPDTLHSDE